MGSPPRRPVPLCTDCENSAGRPSLLAQQMRATVPERLFFQAVSFSWLSPLTEFAYRSFTNTDIAEAADR